jgi:uncharacterized protein YegP (UPF0339 family)
MHFQIYQDRSKRWRWRLLADDGGVIAKSGDGYPTKGICVAYVRLVRRLGDAPVREAQPHGSRR